MVPLFINANNLPVCELFKYQSGIFMFQFHNCLQPPALSLFFTYNNALYSYNTSSRSFFFLGQKLNSKLSRVVQPYGIHCPVKLQVKTTIQSSLHKYPYS